MPRVQKWHPFNYFRKKQGQIFLNIKKKFIDSTPFVLKTPHRYTNSFKSLIFTKEGL